LQVFKAFDLEQTCGAELELFYEESTDFFELNHILHQILILLLAQMIHPMFVESGVQVIEQYPKIISLHSQNNGVHSSGSQSHLQRTT
jgi:hypothetical protein